MVEKNENPNESEPMELVEPNNGDDVVVDAVIVDESAVDEDVVVVDADAVDSTGSDDTVSSAAATESASTNDSTLADLGVDSAGLDAAEREASGATATGEVVVEDSTAAPTADTARVDSEPVAAPVREVQTVYVTAPVPPKMKGNRGIGTLWAFLATIVFAALSLGIAALLILFVRPAGVEGAIGTFVTGPLFYVPALIFLVIMVLWLLLVNRAGWAAWVIGSFVIAVVVYAASVGVLVLMSGGFGLTASEATQEALRYATNPVLIVAGLLAREVSIWFGAAIASRGRKVRERNAAAREEFDREEAEKRAGIGGGA